MDKSEKSVPHDPATSRRGFFRGLVLRGLDKAEQTGRRVAASLPDFIGDPTPQTPQSARPAPTASPRQAALRGVRYLRPPGALPEPDFLSACTRCGDCIRACPAQCIVAVPPPRDEAPGALAFPHIIARTSPCVVCEDLSCMKVCPTDALQLTQSVFAIDMGEARVDLAACLRATGEHCRLCITQCPIGEAAIALDSATDRVAVRPGCIGCGVCERACPTEPASIVVEPAAR